MRTIIKDEDKLKFRLVDFSEAELRAEIILSPEMGMKDLIYSFPNSQRYVLVTISERTHSVEEIGSADGWLEHNCVDSFEDDQSVRDYLIRSKQANLIPVVLPHMGDLLEKVE